MGEQVGIEFDSSLTYRTLVRPSQRRVAQIFRTLAHPSTWGTTSHQKHPARSNGWAKLTRTGIQQSEGPLAAQRRNRAPTKHILRHDQVEFKPPTNAGERSTWDKPTGPERLLEHRRSTRTILRVNSCEFFGFCSLGSVPAGPPYSTLDRLRISRCNSC